MSNITKEEQGKQFKPETKKHVKKRTNKITNICPAEASMNGKGTDTQYKNITILYIKWPLLALAQDYTHIKKR